MLRTALAGLGRIGWEFHLPSILEHPGFSLEAVVDVKPEYLEEAKARCSAAAYSDFSQMLREVKPDAVVIATPTLFHAPQAIEAMEAGADVFLDKPIACDEAEAKQIAAAMQRTGRRLMVYQPHRTYNYALTACEIIDSGIIGPLTMLRRCSHSYVRLHDWQSHQKNGGGQINNTGAHFIDQALYLAGRARAAKVSGTRMRFASSGDAEDTAKILIETDNHITLDVDFSRAAADRKDELILYGMYGCAELVHEKGNEHYHLRYFDPSNITPREEQQGLAAYGRKYTSDAELEWVEKDIPIPAENRINYYDYVYDYFACGKPPFVPVEETLEVMRVIRLLKESAPIAPLHAFEK